MHYSVYILRIPTFSYRWRTVSSSNVQHRHSTVHSTTLHGDDAMFSRLGPLELWLSFCFFWLKMLINQNYYVRWCSSTSYAPRASSTIYYIAYRSYMWLCMCMLRMRHEWGWRPFTMFAFASFVRRVSFSLASSALCKQQHSPVWVACSWYGPDDLHVIVIPTTRRGEVAGEMVSSSAAKIKHILKVCTRINIYI